MLYCQGKEGLGQAASTQLSDPAPTTHVLRPAQHTIEPKLSRNIMLMVSAPCLIRKNKSFSG